MSSDQLAYRVPQAAKALGVGITTVNKMIREGSLRSFKIGKVRVIPADALRALVTGEGARNG